MSALDEIIKTADIHARSIQMALDDLQNIVPFREKTIQSLSKKTFLLTDLLVNRFGKLQDLLGTKLIDAFLLHVGECIDRAIVVLIKSIYWSVLE